MQFDSDPVTSIFFLETSEKIGTCIKNVVSYDVKNVKFTRGFEVIKVINKHNNTV